VNFDLAQAESWIVAYLANEQTIKHVLQNGDFHRETGQKALNKYTDEAWDTLESSIKKVLRYTGKRYNHASAYRMGPFRAAEVINKDSDKPPYVTVSIAESKMYYAAWHSYYNIKPWWQQIEYELDRGRTLVTPYGRSRYFFNTWGDELFKEATAFVPQSTVADHMNGCVQDELGIEGGVMGVWRKYVLTEEIKIINQSHDSILCEIHKDKVLDLCPLIQKELLRPLIVNGEELTIPVDCEIGERWGELKEQKRKVGETTIKFEV
jgi:DNA polymerase I-like protein with 3'-5' exonuclease and polymerase domains